MKELIHSVGEALYKAVKCKNCCLLHQGIGEGIKTLFFYGSDKEPEFKHFNEMLFGSSRKKLPEKDELFQSDLYKEFLCQKEINDIFIREIPSSGSPESTYYLVLFSNKAKWFNTSRKKLIETFTGVICNILESDNSINDEINEVKRIEEDLKATSAGFESILYSVSINEDKFFFINDKVTSLLGYDREEIVNSRFSFLRKIFEKDFMKFKNFVRELKGGSPATVEYQFIDKSGKRHHLHNSGFPVYHDGKLSRIDGVITDVTREKNLQDELQRHEENFRLLIETANDLIFTLNGYGYFLTVNNYGALALGYKPEEMVNRHFLEFVNENSKADVALAFQQILKSDKITSFEVIFVDKYGNDIIFEIQGRPTRSNDEINGLLGIGRDITQRCKDEEKLRDLNSKLIEANRLVSIERDRARQQISVLEEVNKLKSEFISNISHELRTPLASIVGFSETISSDPEMPKEMIMEFNNFIFTEGKRLAKLINDLLDFAKIEGGRVEIYKSSFDVTKLLREILNSVYSSASAKGITITSEIPEIEVLLYADKERIAQVYQNLINNAIKFTNKGGRVTVIAQCFIKEFEVIVSDTGIGIPEKDLPNVFQKFYKVTRPGTQIPGIGLGLGLVKQIVDLHKGMINVQSEVNEGTTFLVKLPLK